MGHRCFYLAVCLVCAFAWMVAGGCGGGGGTPAPRQQEFIPFGVTFCQYDYQGFGGDPLNLTTPVPPFSQPNTEFGGALLQFDAPPGTYWFNTLIQNGTTEWQIQNLPLVAPGGPFEVRLPIDLSDFQSAPGQDVSQLNHASALSVLPLPDPPTDFLTAPVLDYSIDFQTGIRGVLVPAPGPASQPFQISYSFGGLFSIDAGGHGTFTNQECGKNECCPAAVSNSLRTIGVGTDAQNDIETCKGLTEWDADGVAVDWPVAKGAATAGAPYNIDTNVIKPGATEADRIQMFCDIIDALKAGKDVEVDNPWHVAMVTSAAKITIGGKTYYVLHVAHDTSQGKAGGVVNEPIFYDPATNMFSGGTAGFFPGSILCQFTIESKK